MTLSDDEFFIRKAFEADPAQGYERLFKRYGPLYHHAARDVYLWRRPNTSGAIFCASSDKKNLCRRVSSATLLSIIGQ
ncbi:hypothetical protein GCM10027275_42790 [Rhabdobacter roseus]|uniref:Uncharacterized protein n=1 Tax=Rhabdobacter roseus TaxID=1655419 RepID=A0A840U2U3_9BACT|nr:hypothetical protein [Rhabdobacter roseus]MBB5286668.1 hypothetical protein [Rhabdobacter roseus]